MRILFLMAVVIWILTSTISAAEGESYRPSIELEKKKYILGEHVMLWENACPIDGKDFQGPPEDAFYLEIKKPDASIAKQRLGEPGDGMVGACWKGGLHPDKDVFDSPGTYRLVIHQYGLRSDEAQIVVEEAGILSKVEAGFEFLGAQEIGTNEEVPFRFFVKNNSDEDVIFQGLDSDMYISMRVTTENPPCSSGDFVTQPGSPGAAADPEHPIDSHGWDKPGTLRGYVVLAPGESFEKTLSFKVGEFCLQQTGRRRQRIDLSASMDVYVGSKGGPYTDFCPFKKDLHESKEFTIGGMPGIMEANDEVAKRILRSISTASEAYATANSGHYPGSIVDLTKAIPPYLNTGLCDQAVMGFVFNCEFGATAYKITATPAVAGETGLTTFTITTGGVIQP